jgi:hypothetical protein
MALFGTMRSVIRERASPVPATCKRVGCQAQRSMCLTASALATWGGRYNGMPKYRPRYDHLPDKRELNKPEGPNALPFPSDEKQTLSRRCHFAAFFSAIAASLCALFAMLRLVLCAFIAAGLANIGTHLADRLRILTPACHERRRHPAYLRAIHIECDAPRHHLDILFLQAGSSAVVASGGTCVTGIDTGLGLLMRHIFSF